MRDDDGNDDLVAGIAEVVASELPLMRKAGLITDGLLEALPNNADTLKPRYESIRHAVLKAFENATDHPGGWRPQLCGVAPSYSLGESDPSRARSRRRLELRTITDGEAEAAGWLQEREIEVGHRTSLISVPASTSGVRELSRCPCSVCSDIQEEIDLYEDEPGLCRRRRSCRPCHLGRHGLRDSRREAESVLRRARATCRGERRQSLRTH